VWRGERALWKGSDVEDDLENVKRRPAFAFTAEEELTTLKVGEEWTV